MLEFVFVGTIHPTLSLGVIAEQFHLDEGGATLTIQKLQKANFIR